MKQAYQRIPNFNILPEEYRRPILSTLQVCLILVIVAAATFSYFGYQNRAESKANVADLEEELSQLQKDLGEIGEISSLADQAKELQSKLDGIEEAGQQVDWSALISLLQSASGIQVDSIIQEGELELKVVGKADDRTAFDQYTERVGASPQVSGVSFEKREKIGSSWFFEMRVEVGGG